ncbi:hypothetical protein O9X99_19790 [Agrobacterium salinitolerans]|uniref:Uncharacterized protein n=1 Tax=Agrobacterium salinitolerans TaxID=1183413 RepID=A0A9X3KS15_9HYPH|nr:MULTISPECIES: hypothetical protein [Agrobacterium]MCZ7854683.1 hypothetical protein [Agrobacterium salinitolerans]MCZ7893916.1 hypothetical protein [Agrobacterium salinitolerans]MCZ7939867.1 hypothetical protein [Agrobacterium salinitolerans]TRA84215.1 hypothetical protein EXN23_22920 [Agrobacterium salinitolerans]
MQIRRKPRPDEMPHHLAHSLYSARLGAHDQGCYRSTPPGAPDVAALVRPGMMVGTSYGTGGIVIMIEGSHVHVTTDGREYPHFTIVYVPAHRFGRHTKVDHNWINECVAVDGRILMLFEANTDEVFFEAVPIGQP